MPHIIFKIKDDLQQQHSSQRSKTTFISTHNNNINPNIQQHSSQPTTTTFISTYKNNIQLNLQQQHLSQRTKTTFISTYNIKIHFKVQKQNLSQSTTTTLISTYNSNNINLNNIQFKSSFHCPRFVCWIKIYHSFSLYFYG